MVSIKNRQRAVAVDTKQLKKDAQIVLKDLGYSDYDLGILLTTNKTIHQYNKQYRDKDKPTDILSFPFYPDLKAGERISAQTDDEKNLGDIIISPEYVQTAAAELGVSFDERMQVLLVHGICHLLGYDHIEDEDYEVMKKEEERLLKILKNRL